MISMFFRNKRNKEKEALFVKYSTEKFISFAVNRKTLMCKYDIKLSK